jgi:hypothetical protein
MRALEEAARSDGCRNVEGEHGEEGGMIVRRARGMPTARSETFRGCDAFRAACAKERERRSDTVRRRHQAPAIREP